MGEMAPSTGQSSGERGDRPGRALCHRKAEGGGRSRQQLCACAPEEARAGRGPLTTCTSSSRSTGFAGRDHRSLTRKTAPKLGNRGRKEALENGARKGRSLLNRCRQCGDNFSGGSPPACRTETPRPRSASRREHPELGSRQTRFPAEDGNSLLPAGPHCRNYRKAHFRGV